MKKIIAAVAAALVLPACATSTWQEDLRAELDVFFEDVTNQDVENFCFALAGSNLDTAEEVGWAILATDTAGEIPPRDVTVQEWWEETGGEPIANVPAYLTVGDLLDEAGQYLLDLCE